MSETPDIAPQVGQIAQTVGGTDVAGIYGDPAGASQSTPAQSPAEVAQGLVAAGGQAASPDVAALLARIEAMEAANKAAADKAAADAKAAEPKPPVLEEILAAVTGASPGVVHALTVIAERLSAAGL